MNKVAQITAYFWIMKICATTLGETAGDLLSMTMNLGCSLSSVILIVLFMITLTTQLAAGIKAKRPCPSATSIRPERNFSIGSPSWFPTRWAPPWATSWPMIPALGSWEELA
jgi:hypothetical protein